MQERNDTERFDSPLRHLTPAQFMALGGNAVVYVKMVPGDQLAEMMGQPDLATGDEFHLEWAATKYLTKEFTIGLVGYYYQQLTPDSGVGPSLGAFEGLAIHLVEVGEDTFTGSGHSRILYGALCESR